MASSRKVYKDDTYMDYLKIGSGKETLVIIPGLSTKGIKGSGLLMNYYFRVFKKKYTIYVFDRKEQVPQGYTVSDIAEDVVYAMRELGISKADILGVSQGGMITQMIGIRCPELVNRIVLAVTASRPNDTIRGTVGKWIEYAKEGDFAAINTEGITKTYSDAYVAKNKALIPVLAKMMKLSPKALEKFTVLANAVVTFDCYDELDRIKYPALVIGARQDNVVSVEASEEIAEKLNCPLYIYENYGHAVYDEAKDFYSRALAFFEG